MKIQNKSGSAERSVLIGMIVNQQVLGRVASRWRDEGLFASSMANTVGKWCVKFYRKHNGAPGKSIETIFRSWADTADKNSVKLIEKFLTSIAGQYSRMKKEINAGFVLDTATELFNEVAAKNLIQAVEGDLEIGKSSDALKRINTFLKIDIGAGESIDVLNDKLAIAEALDDEANATLIKYSGAAGEFFGNALARECFIGVMGPEKRGKSWVLLDMAWRAMLQRRKVAFFEAGDLSKRQIMRRIYTRAMGRPLKPTRPDRPLMYPTNLTRLGQVTEGEESSFFDVSHEHRTYKDSVTESQIQKALERIKTEKIKSQKQYLKLSVHANSSLSTIGMRSILRDWESYDDWTPDVVVLDYADILAPPPGFHGESRDAVNDNWKALRRMSQELHCLVIVGTQANAASYTSPTLGMQNFSEDKRKFSHVTGILGLNQTNDEKKKALQRWNWLVLREEEFITSDSVTVAQCLGIANPCVRSIA